MDRNQIDDGQCTPITVKDGKPYYPCGLIANSVFNGEHAGGSTGMLIPFVAHTPSSTHARIDTYTDLRLLNPTGGSEASQPYALSEKNIAWSGEAKHYTNSPPGQPSDYLPPPNWAARYPDGYTEFPALADDEHFHVWMRTAALPTFSKLWARNDDDVMQSGTYEMIINMSECRGVRRWPT
jgi:hypothetical protein